MIAETVATFAYQSLREEQKKDVKDFVAGKDVLYPFQRHMGTRYATYMPLLLIFDKRRETVERRSIVMVVSPLVALMKDQSAKFTERERYNSVQRVIWIAWRKIQKRRS